MVRQFPRPVVWIDFDLVSLDYFLYTIVFGFFVLIGNLLQELSVLLLNLWLIDLQDRSN